MTLGKASGACVGLVLLAGLLTPASAQDIRPFSCAAAEGSWNEETEQCEEGTIILAEDDVLIETIDYLDRLAPPRRTGSRRDADNEGG